MDFLDEQVIFLQIACLLLNETEHGCCVDFFEALLDVRNSALVVRVPSCLQLRKVLLELDNRLLRQFEFSLQLRMPLSELGALEHLFQLTLHSHLGLQRELVHLQLRHFFFACLHLQNQIPDLI